MSYPFDTPSLLMSSTWQSGSYKPYDVTKKIINNITPVNKLSITNSVGNEISLIQNYVNSKLLGRDSLPIESGFITNLKSLDGGINIYASGYNPTNDTYGIIEYNLVNASSIFMQHAAQTPVSINTTYGTSGFYTSGINESTDSQNRQMWCYPEQFCMDGSGPDNYFNLSSWNYSVLPYSGIRLSHTISTSSDKLYVDINPHGISWVYNDTYSLDLYVNASGKNLELHDSLVIGGFTPHGGLGSHYGLTINNDDDKGDLFIKTHGGGGFEFIGTGGTYDYINSLGEYLTLESYGGTKTAYLELSSAAGLCTLAGNVSVLTTSGGGINLTSSNSTNAYVTSTGPSLIMSTTTGSLGQIRIDSTGDGSISLITGASCIQIPGSGVITLPANATDPASSYALVNAIKSVLNQRGWTA